MADLSKTQQKSIEASKTKAKKMLSRFMPFDQWIAERPRSEQEIELHNRILGELEKIAAEGQVREITTKSRRFETT